MSAENELLIKNKEWVAEKLQLNAEFFSTMAKGQAPKVMFIGCADSRTAPEVATKSDMGELFVHRNVANQVEVSSLLYAVNHLKVEHVVVCGHTSCGGVGASLSDSRLEEGIEDWIAPIRALAHKHADELAAIPNETDRQNRLSELNVLAQVAKIKAIETKGNFKVHAWMFDLAKGTISEVK